MKTFKWEIHVLLKHSLIFSHFLFQMERMFQFCIIRQIKLFHYSKRLSSYFHYPIPQLSVCFSLDHLRWLYISMVFILFIMSQYLERPHILVWGRLRWSRLWLDRLVGWLYKRITIVKIKCDILPAILLTFQHIVKELYFLTIIELEEWIILAKSRQIYTFNQTVT